MGQIFQGGEKPKCVSHFKHYSMSSDTLLKHQSAKTKWLTYKVGFSESSHDKKVLVLVLVFVREGCKLTNP